MHNMELTPYIRRITTTLLQQLLKSSFMLAPDSTHMRGMSGDEQSAIVIPSARTLIALSLRRSKSYSLRVMVMISSPWGVGPYKKPDNAWFVTDG